MRTAYKVLAYLVAAEVAIQSMAMVWAIAGSRSGLMAAGCWTRPLLKRPSEVAGWHSRRSSAFWCTASTGCS